MPTRRHSMSKPTPIPSQLPLFDSVVIKLSKGYEAVVDAADSDLMQFKWCAHVDRKNNVVYAYRTVYSDRKDTVMIHRVILSRMLNRALDSKEKVDHIDRDGLNNRRSNLRLATSCENGFNRCRNRNSKSGLKGVSWHKKNRKWVANIRVKGKRIYLGSFANAQDAYAVYCEAAKRHFGEFARFE